MFGHSGAETDGCEDRAQLSPCLLRHASQVGVAIDGFSVGLDVCVCETVLQANHVCVRHDFLRENLLTRHVLKLPANVRLGVLDDLCLHSFDGGLANALHRANDFFHLGVGDMLLDVQLVELPYKCSDPCAVLLLCHGFSRSMRTDYVTLKNDFCQSVYLLFRCCVFRVIYF